MKKMKRDFISLLDLSRDEIENLFKHAKVLKEEVAAGKYRKTLAGRSLAMIFEKPSTRTRISFEVGMTQLGGHSLYLSPAETQIGRNEPLKDTARVISSYCDGIIIRTFEHEKVLELAKWSAAPVINALSDLQHPCQILSDMFTIIEHFGSLKGIRVAFIGDGNNVANSWVHAAGRMNIPLSLACPEGHDPDPRVLADAMEGTGASIRVVRKPADAAKGASVIYTDVWASMGQEHEEEERKKAFMSYRVDEALLKLASPDAIIMHCLPAHRGEEITDEAVEGRQSVVFVQAANRLHVQKAVLEWLLVPEKVSG